jgi:hypothetical protein
VYNFSVRFIFLAGIVAGSAVAGFAFAAGIFLWEPWESDDTAPTKQTTKPTAEKRRLTNEEAIGLVAKE